MTGSDWESRYVSGDMPWEKGEGSPGLADFLARRSDLARGSVLVPGCGTGHDVRTWARHGFAATGLDIAPSAIRRGLERSEAESIATALRLGDFLRDPASESFDWIFEHTLYCAIQPSDRDLYAEAVRRWLRPQGHFLAVHYMIRDIEGPPFGCTQEELMERFEPHFELLDGWLPRSYPNRTGRELMLLWRKRPD